MTVPEGSSTDRTIGVAITVPEPYAAQLRAHRESFGDPLASTVPPHVTLLPPTPVPLVDAGNIDAHLADLAATSRPFDIELRGSATFRPVSPVVFVPLVRGISECEQLERRVRRAPLAREVPFYYHPHVTVAHHVDDAALDRAEAVMANFSCRFAVTGFDLYEHIDGGWHIAHSYPLR
ncbi:MAG: 2'-5' RNA ligase family protein [Actinomycetota bacterium]